MPDEVKGQNVSPSNTPAGSVQCAGLFCGSFCFLVQHFVFACLPSSLQLFLTLFLSGKKQEAAFNEKHILTFCVKTHIVRDEDEDEDESGQTMCTGYDLIYGAM